MEKMTPKSPQIQFLQVLFFPWTALACRVLAVLGGVSQTRVGTGISQTLPCCGLGEWSATPGAPRTTRAQKNIVWGPRWSYLFDAYDFPASFSDPCSNNLRIFLCFVACVFSYCRLCRCQPSAVSDGVFVE